MLRNPSDANSEMYKLNIVTFEHDQTEEFLALMKNFKIEFDGTGTVSVSGKIKHLRILLRGKALRGFYELSRQNNGTSNAHLNLTQEVLLGYFFLVTPFPSRSVQCAVQFVNLAISFSNAFMPVSRNSTNASLFFQDQAPPRRCPRRTQRYSPTCHPKRLGITGLSTGLGF